MTLLSMFLTIIATFSACGFCISQAHKISKKGQTRNMTNLERLKVSVMVGFPIGVALLYTIWAISSIFGKP